ncbi:TetR/AcrR family transcriptional regulator [Piscibacillus halophilus]|uniref:Transcriptional regulator, TetR family n=1 Tax=Piscibacillus halophilus TaxID=571933 RepID=A0A1H9IPZ0_9BACI|nr:TetR/AcrR family transcriptional regulator [Piscibacillus halophilus]SEQ76626.1 transcriptional regulator, TetR family [Piscibacillus halophilus]
MNDKKKRIIKGSIELFAHKGFHATSVQEIVDQANVAKGSFYNYFESKEDLIVSIYDYYYVTILERMKEAQKEQDPRQSLIKQFEIYFNFIIENKPLIVMLLRDQVPLGQNAESFIIQTRQQNFNWSKANILAIYGDSIKPFENDAAVLLEGMIHCYTSWIVVDEKTIDRRQLPKFLLNRLENVCQGMMNEEEHPAIQRLPNVFEQSALLLTKIRQLIHSAIQDPSKALEALDVIEQEVQKENPQNIIIESMLDHLKKFSALNDEVLTLEETLEREIL